MSQGAFITFSYGSVPFVRFYGFCKLSLSFTGYTMKDFTKRLDSFSRIEFWAVLTIFVFKLFFFTEGINNFSHLRAPNKELFVQAGVPFHYYLNYFVPLLIRFCFLFLSFLLLNFILVPMLVKKQNLLWSIGLITLVFLSGCVVLGMTDTYIRAYLFRKYASTEETYKVVYQQSILYALGLLTIFGFYSLVKYAGLYILSNSERLQAKYKFINREGLVAFVIWMLIMLFLRIFEADGELMLGWALTIPFGIVFYWYAFYSLIPRCLRKKKPFSSYLLRTVLLLAISILPTVFLLMVLIQDGEASIGYSFFNVAIQLLITAPLSWVLFKRRIKGNEEIYSLKKALGQSHANFDFLRSQINPHFLFNALNTIYGTALQEKAERTSETVEKLGDMMRFMLQENMQEKIPLAREIEYLNNYISFQKLRTDPDPNIKIEAHIEEQVHPIQIPPMLLIPFVENAFKHGISLREPSRIIITLETRNNILHFDVFNSKHQKPEDDPEKNRSGIGLHNVKQRLQLLYPGKHELIIRQTTRDFYVHLTIHLS